MNETTLINLNRLETHDRLEEFTKKDFDIAACCQNLIDQRPFGERPFYIFAHARTDDDGLTKRLIWQPRLTRPESQINSMLFKASPGSDNIKIIWMIPAREMWDQYVKGNVTENNLIQKSIETFRFNKVTLDTRDPEDPSDDVVDAIYKEIAQQARQKKMMENLYKEKTNE